MSLQWANIDNCFEKGNYNYNEKKIPNNPDIFLSRNLDVNMRNVGNLNDILFKPSNDEINNTNIFNYEEFDYYNKNPFIENKTVSENSYNSKFTVKPKIPENNYIPSIKNISNSSINNYIQNEEKSTNIITNNKFNTISKLNFKNKPNRINKSILKNYNISSNIIQYPKKKQKIII